MKIAYYVWEYYPRLVGGLGTYAIEITRRFVVEGHEVIVFTLNPGDLTTRELWRGIMIHRPKIVDTLPTLPTFVSEDLKDWGMNLRFFGDVFCYNLLSASKFLNELVRKDNEHFDVVCVHDWLSAMAGLIIKSEEKELPVVFHVHSTEQLRTLGQGSRVVREFEKEMAEKADKIVTVSYAMRDHLISLGYPTEKIRVCWNGCDPEKYDPAKINSKKIASLKEEYGIQPDEKVILFIGRLTWVKGVHNLITSFPAVLQDYPKSKLVILGKGEDYADLQRLAHRLNIQQNIIFKSEWVTEEQRIIHYAMADLCVFPSIHEPFGIVSLESMSMKKPVVVGASGVSGLREQVISSGPNQCGVHVDGKNPVDIAWGIKEVLKDAERAREWGENGRKRVLQFFTWDKVAEDTISIYEETLKSQRAPGGR